MHYMWLSQVETLSRLANHFRCLVVDLCRARADAPMREEGAEKYYREGSLSLPARVEQTRVGSSVVTGFEFRARDCLALAVDLG